ncbi:Inner membrane ABC transporter permease protein YdcV [Micromonospora sp. MW-13]|uniref:ABC transporter permease n=1 Tax=Micromonospora sp. MW-13 TaxID=2094022 RepID=UPI000EE5BC9B|nr:ABC transporter permease [Micromonospora sp. MW-13]RGC66811.1 Inner membrane ABC transporter permease protein YdcV [Micromonospora sp. MW-13]
MKYLPEAIYRTIGAVVVIACYLFLLAPLLVVFVISFDAGANLEFPPKEWSLRWYAELAGNSEFLEGLRVSLVLGLVVTAVSLIVGVTAALALTRYDFTGRDGLVGLFTSPLLLPSVVLGLALLLVLGPVGLVGTYPGLVLAHLSLTIPYVVRTVMMSLNAVDASCEQAARTLGASPFTTFRRITLPLITPGLIAGGALSFIISFDEAVVSLFVVGTGRTTLPVVVFRYVSNNTDPQVAALSVVLIVFSLAAVVLIERALGLKRVLSRA